MTFQSKPPTVGPNDVPAMPRVIGPALAEAALPWPALLQALREAFVQGVEVPPRQVLRWPDGAGGEVMSLLMPAWSLDAADPGGGFYGVKLIQVAPGNAARGLPGLHGLYVLHEAATGRPLAVIDGDVLTARRTAAASALAASLLARADACRLLVVGAGRLAALLPHAHAAVRDLREVNIWARRPEAAAALAAQLRTQGLPAQAVRDLPEAVASADIVSTATLSHQPFVQGAWLAPGSHLDLVGSFTPAMREADDEALRGARIVPDTAEATTKSGDLIEPLQRGVIRPEDVADTLATLCRGQAPGRTSEAQRTVFKSVGNALEDLAAARLVWAQAQRSSE